MHSSESSTSAIVFAPLASVRVGFAPFMMRLADPVRVVRGRGVHERVSAVVVDGLDVRSVL